MRALFVGGSQDGKSRFITAGARYYMVPVWPTTATAEDFLNLDYKDECCKVERYKRTAFDRETFTVTYTFDGEE